MQTQIKPSVHIVLAQSYMVYFIFCSIGLFLETFFPLKIFIPHAIYFAILFFALGPMLILWAQYTSYKFERVKKETGEPQFNRGPYRYLRNPTQLGLLLLVAGYALATHGIMLFVSTALAYVISNIFFRRHEAILESRYGQKYQEYKSSVPKIM